MSEEYETLEYKGYTIKIYPEGEIAQNPRTEWDNFGTMVCWHRRYTLGDEQPTMSPDEYLVELAELYYDDFDFEWESALNKALKILEKTHIILDLRLYDHGGITMSATGGYPYNDMWDSMQVGFIYVSLEDIRKEWGVKRVSKALREKVIKLLLSEVDVYDNYLTGAVFFYNVEDREGEIIDSCGGFYGYEWDKNGLTDYAYNAIDYHVKEDAKKAVLMAHGL